MNRLSIAGVASALLLCASLALAESSTTTVALLEQRPNPSVVGQPVTLRVTVTKVTGLSQTCTGPAQIVDTTGGGNVTICNAASLPINGAPNRVAVAWCDYAFPITGLKTLEVSYSGGSSCQASVGAAP